VAGSTTSPPALTTASAPIVVSPLRTPAVPSPPRIAFSGPSSLPIVAPVPAPTRPRAIFRDASAAARSPIAASGHAVSPTARSKITAAGTIGTRIPRAS
jgi:hypothetical protein